MLMRRVIRLPSWRTVTLDYDIFYDNGPFLNGEKSPCHKNVLIKQTAYYEALCRNHGTITGLMPFRGV